MEAIIAVNGQPRPPCPPCPPDGDGRRGGLGTVLRSPWRLLRRAAGLEASVLLTILVAIVGAWAFIEIADMVRDEETLGFDRRVILALRSGEDPARPVGPEWLGGAARDITALGGWAVLTILDLAVAGFLILRRRWGMLVLVAVAVLGGEGLEQGLKVLFGRERPTEVPHLAPAQGMSFPSGHAMLSAIVYLTLGGLLARLVPDRRSKAFILAVAVVLTALVGSTRVFLGVHYPTDVLAGWSAGLAWAALCALAARALARRRVIEGAGPGQSMESE